MNDFENRIKTFSTRAKEIKENLSTEEATKTSLVLPFFSMLGYDIFNPMEFVPEFTADVGIKKGEKVDYAILSESEPMILIECKSVNEQLTKHDSQLFRYFGTTTAKFAILTNGIIYRFFTDLEETNKMDEKPFLELNITNLKDNHISELKKFHKDNFDLQSIKNTASDLKYLGLIRGVLHNIFTEIPDDEFVKFILSSGVYDGVKTQNVIDKYKPLVRKSINLYINDLVSEKIQSALNSQVQEEKEINENADNDEEICDIEEKNELIITEEELQSYYIVKSILRDNIDIKRIQYKNTHSYFGIILDGKVTQWICRVVLKEKINYVIIRNEKDEKFIIDNIDGIYDLKEQLVNRINNLLN